MWELKTLTKDLLTVLLEIINHLGSAVTFDGHKGQSCIDLLLVGKCTHRITDWIIPDWATLSDYNAMIWTYQGKPRAQ